MSSNSPQLTIRL